MYDGSRYQSKSMLRASHQQRPLSRMKICNRGVTASENMEPVREAKWDVSLDLMSQEKCNFHYEEREQVSSQIRNCRNAEGEILGELTREGVIARITSYQSDNRGKGSFCVYFSNRVPKISSEQDCDDIGGSPDAISETKEAEASAWNLGSLEVRSHTRVVQVVIVSMFNLRPRGPIIWNFDQTVLWDRQTKMHDPQPVLSGYRAHPQAQFQSPQASLHIHRSAPRAG